MFIYVIIATFFYLGFFMPNKFQDIYYKISVMILFIFTAFRNVNLGGYDAENYQTFFYEKVPKLLNILQYKTDYGYGYAIFNSLIKTIVEDYRVYQVVYTILAITLLCVVIKKLQLNKRERNLFLFVYFCQRFMWNNFVLLRQNIAMLIVWIILLTLFDKPVKYCLGVMISWLWHITSLINTLLYPLLKYMKNIKKNKMLLITFIVSIFFLLFSKPIFNYLLKLFVGIVGSKYTKYVWDLSDSDNQGINIINYLLRWFFLLFFYYYYKKINNPNKGILLNISFLAIILGSINTAIVSRMVEYYMISIYSMITVSHQAFKGKEKIMYLLGIFLLHIVILVRFLYTFSGGELLKYSTFFY